MREKVVNVTSITHEEWLTYRRGGIGGSDSATIMGLNPYSSLYYLYCDKLGILEPKEDNEAMRQGRDLEQYVADRWMEATGKKCHRNNYMWRSVEWPWMQADIDREITGENAGLECKTTNAFTKYDFANGEVPLNYYTQCQHYMAVMGFDRMYLAVVVLGRGFYHFVIERSDEEIEILAEHERQFWEHVQAEEPPEIDGSEATAEALKQRFPQEVSDVAVELSNHTASEIEHLSELQDIMTQLKADCDAIKNKIKEEMGTAPVALTNTHSCSWQNRSSRKIDWQRLKKEYPEAYADCVTTSENRTLTIKERKDV